WFGSLFHRPSIVLEFATTNAPGRALLTLAVPTNQRCRSFAYPTPDPSSRDRERHQAADSHQRQHGWGPGDAKPRDHRADSTRDDRPSDHRGGKEPRRRAGITGPELGQPDDSGWKYGRDREAGDYVGDRRRGVIQRHEECECRHGGAD